MATFAQGTTPAIPGSTGEVDNKKENRSENEVLNTIVEQVKTVEDGPLFENPFQIEDITVFDDATLREILTREAFGVKIQDLALALHNLPGPVLERVCRNLGAGKRSGFLREVYRAAPPRQIEDARRRILDGLFWELTYWKTPGLYEELIEGERLHPGIFQRLAPELQGKTVLDAGAGSGRASFECLRYHARLVYAVEPSPGLLNILEQKVNDQPANHQIVPLRGRFDNLPLEDNTVDVAISCSAFTAEPEQGGTPGLNELKRVTRPGGQIVIIWPRPEDREWLSAHGFHYEALPIQQEMKVSFRSFRSAWRCARRFYARNRAVVNYLMKFPQRQVPFRVLGFNPPHDYCWLKVQK